MSRLLVVYRCRPDLNVKDAIGEYEFNVTPPSNFHPDGSMIMISDKSQIVTSIRNLPLPQNTDFTESDNDTSIMIIDAMCIVNMITMTKDIFTAKHFAHKFIEFVSRISSKYDEVRVVFDQYISNSLKESTRKKRTSNVTTIQFHVHDDTEIKSLKIFL